MGATTFFICITAIILFVSSRRHKERMEIINRGILPYINNGKGPAMVGSNSLLTGLLALGFGLAFAVSSLFLNGGIDAGMLFVSFLFQCIGGALIGYWKLTEPDRKIARRYHEERIEYFKKASM